jgi:hypothetical protein
VPVGAVEVDLSPLLLPRPAAADSAARPHCRWLSGVFAVVHPMCKNLGNARVKVKVLFDLQPAELPSQQLLADPVAHWQVSGPLAALSAPASAVAAAAAAQTAAAAAAGFTSAFEPAADAAAAAAAGEDQGGDAVVVTSSTAAADEPDLAAAVAAAELLQELQQQPLAEPADAASQPVNISSAADADVFSVADKSAATFVDIQDDGAPLTGPVHKRSSSRLRAEVSHASAPAAARSSSSSPAADTQQQREQDKQQQHGKPDGGSKPLPVLEQPEPQQQLQQQQQVVLHQSQQQQQEVELPVALADVRVCVEGALHLQLPLLPEGG